MNLGTAVVLSQAVQAYSDDEPRDARGRWASSSFNLSESQEAALRGAGLKRVDERTWRGAKGDHVYVSLGPDGKAKANVLSDHTYGGITRALGGARPAAAQTKSAANTWQGNVVKWAVTPKQAAVLSKFGLAVQVVPASKLEPGEYESWKEASDTFEKDVPKRMQDTRTWMQSGAAVHPLLVETNGVGGYYVMDGHHRFVAADALGEGKFAVLDLGITGKTPSGARRTAFTDAYFEVSRTKLKAAADPLSRLKTVDAPAGKWSTLVRAKRKKYGTDVWKKSPIRQVAKPTDAEAFKRLPVKRRDVIVNAAPVRSFDPRDLVTNQPVVNEGGIRHFLRGGGDKEPLIVLRTRIGLYIHNGNHRAVTALLQGKKLKARFVDLSQISGAAGMCECGHPVSAHRQAPDFACDVCALCTGLKLEAYSEDQPRDAQGKFSPDYGKLTNGDVKEPPLRVPVGKHASAGIVMLEPDGKVWVVSPKDYYGGYRNTFPKGTVDKGESMQHTAVRETYEESGLLARITGHLGDVERTTSVARYYLGQRVAGDTGKARSETHAVKQFDVNDLDTDSRMHDVNGRPTADAKVLQMIRNHLQQKDLAGRAVTAYSDDEQRDEHGKWTAGNVLHEQVAGAKGTNQGGFYRGKDAVNRYVKFYSNSAQGRGEAAANTIYRDLGVNAPKSGIFKTADGREAFASEIIPGGTTLQKQGLTKEAAQEVLRGFAADVLTANWDSVGLVYDNILMRDGEAHRVDNGAAFLYRAQGGTKPEALLSKTTEFEGFFNPSVNREYARLAQVAGYKSAADIPSLKQQVQGIVSLQNRSGGWDKYLAAKAPFLSASERMKMAGMLTARTASLAQKVGMKNTGIAAEFNPDEPRDKDGKWSGGGDAPSAAAKPEITPSGKASQLQSMGFKYQGKTTAYANGQANAKETWIHPSGAQVHVSKYNAPNQPNLRKFEYYGPKGEKLVSSHQFSKVAEAHGVAPAKVAEPKEVAPAPAEKPAGGDYTLPKEAQALKDAGFTYVGSSTGQSGPSGGPADLWKNEKLGVSITNNDTGYLIYKGGGQVGHGIDVVDYSGELVGGIKQHLSEESGVVPVGAQAYLKEAGFTKDTYVGTSQSWVHPGGASALAGKLGINVYKPDGSLSSAHLYESSTGTKLQEALSEAVKTTTTKSGDAASPSTGKTWVNTPDAAAAALQKAGFAVPVSNQAGWEIWEHPGGATVRVSPNGTSWTVRVKDKNGVTGPKIGGVKNMVQTPIVKGNGKLWTSVNTALKQAAEKNGPAGASPVKPSAMPTPAAKKPTAEEEFAKVASVTPKIAAVTKNAALSNAGYKCVGQGVQPGSGKAMDVWQKATGEKVHIVDEGGDKSTFQYFKPNENVASGTGKYTNDLNAHIAPPQVSPPSPADTAAKTPYQKPEVNYGTDKVWQGKVRDMVDQYWNKTPSNTYTHNGDNLYKRVATEMNIPQAKINEVSSAVSSWQGGHTANSGNVMGKWAQDIVNGSDNVHPGAYLEYAVTQRWLKENPGITKTMYRGYSGTGAEEGKTSVVTMLNLIAKHSPDEFHVQVPVNGAEGFSTNQAWESGKKFTNGQGVMVIKHDVEAKNVFSGKQANPVFWQGYDSEQEWALAFEKQMMPLSTTKGDKLKLSHLGAAASTLSRKLVMNAIAELVKQGWGWTLVGNTLTLLPPPQQVDWIRKLRRPGSPISAGEDQQVPEFVASGSLEEDIVDAGTILREVLRWRAQRVDSAAYKLAGYTSFQGLPISIETKKGETRSGVNGHTGKAWSVVMPFDYGYVKGTRGADGDAVDCFIGSLKDAKFAYGVHQTTQDGRRYDEDKWFLGFRSADAAKAAYEAAYDNGGTFFHSMTVLPMHEFVKKVLATKNLQRPGKIHARTA